MNILPIYSRENAFGHDRNFKKIPVEILYNAQETRKVPHVLFRFIQLYQGLYVAT
jgi:hypothetical protein